MLNFLAQDQSEWPRWAGKTSVGPAAYDPDMKFMYKSGILSSFYLQVLLKTWASVTRIKNARQTYLSVFGGSSNWRSSISSCVECMTN